MGDAAKQHPAKQCRVADPATHLGGLDSLDLYPIRMRSNSIRAVRTEMNGQINHSASPLQGAAWHQAKTQRERESRDELLVSPVG